MPAPSARLVIDGNNLMFALADELVDAGRSMLASMLARYEDATGAEVCVVFDGFASRGDESARILEIFPHIHFSGERKADDVITDILKSCSAPRTLTVVSSDRQLRRAASRRKAASMDSASFARELVFTLANINAEEPIPAEPPEKLKGLPEGELDKWLDEFGI